MSTKNENNEMTETKKKPLFLFARLLAFFFFSFLFFLYDSI